MASPAKNAQLPCSFVAGRILWGGMPIKAWPGCWGLPDHTSKLACDHNAEMSTCPTMQSLQSAAAREQLDSQQLQYAKVQQQQLQAARDTAALLQQQVDAALTQVSPSKHQPASQQPGGTAVLWPASGCLGDRAGRT